MSEVLDLAEYRRRVFHQYASVRSSADPQEAWNHWRRGRDELFRTHPQTPLDRLDRTSEYEAPFFAYDRAYRVSADVHDVEGGELDISHGSPGSTRFRPFGTVEVALPGGSFLLTLYWLSGYGGGIFLPLRDATAGLDTYGGGRYLLDTAKGADLGMDDGRLVLDFNFAYHPSCVYSDRWSCPLAPQENHVDVAIPAGERLAQEAGRD